MGVRGDVSGITNCFELLSNLLFEFRLSADDVLLYYYESWSLLLRIKKFCWLLMPGLWLLLVFLEIIVAFLLLSAMDGLLLVDLFFC